MAMKMTQDAMGTHLHWEHEGITPKMIDWFWSNMEKSFLLWHPEQHEPLVWAIAPKHGNPIGSVYIAPQTWNDGTRQNLYIRFEDLSTIPDEIKEYIVYEHVVVGGGLGLGEESMKQELPMGYRIHQWQKTDYGVVGKSSAIGLKKKETPEEGLVWAAHCEEEIGNWGNFLAEIYNLFKVVKNADYNPYADFTVVAVNVEGNIIIYNERAKELLKKENSEVINKRLIDVYPELSFMFFSRYNKT